MIIELTIKNVVVYKKLQKSFTDRQTGKEVPYYQLVLDQNDNVETFSCTEDAYNVVTTGRPCVLLAEFNTSSATNAKIRIIGVDAPQYVRTYRERQFRREKINVYSHTRPRFEWQLATIPRNSATAHGCAVLPDKLTDIGFPFADVARMPRCPLRWYTLCCLGRWARFNYLFNLSPLTFYRV